MPNRITAAAPAGPWLQVLVTLHAAGDVVDGFALFPDQFHPVDPTIALVEEGQKAMIAIGTRYPK